MFYQFQLPGETVFKLLIFKSKGQKSHFIVKEEDTRITWSTEVTQMNDTMSFKRMGLIDTIYYLLMRIIIIIYYMIILIYH